jgi:hypothetical protein
MKVFPGSHGASRLLKTLMCVLESKIDRTLSEKPQPSSSYLRLRFGQEHVVTRLTASGDNDGEEKRQAQKHTLRHDLRTQEEMTRRWISLVPS